MAESYNEEKSKALDKPREYPLTSPSYPYSISEEAEPHLRDYLHVILRRKWIIITFFVAIVTTVTIGTFMMKPQYKSTVTIKIDRENPNILAFKDIVSLERAEEDYYQTQYKTMKSRNLAKRVIRTLRLDENPEFVPQQQNKGSKAEAETLVKPAMLFENESLDSRLVDAFIGKIDVSPLQKSRLVNVSFTSHKPELSAKVANALAESFIGLNIESKFEATYHAREWLEKQLDILKAKVEQAEEKLNQYAAKHGIIFLDERGKNIESQNIITKRLSELSTELTNAMADRINKEAIYNVVHSGEHESSAIVMGNVLIQSLKKDYATLDSEYNQLLKIYKPGYPKMVRLKEHIDQVKKKIDLETKKVVSSIKKDYEAAVKRENYLKVAFEAQKKEALNLNERSIQYQILKREADTNKELYNGLLQRLKETGVSSTLTASNIQVLDRAEVPKSPSKPRKALNIMLSIIVGLLGGIGLAFFVEYLDNTVKTPEDVEKKVYLPSLGLVPRYVNNKENLPVECITHTDVKSSVSEAYSSIRTFLLLSTGGRPPRIIMVTSPARKDGKTTTAINTAISLTKSNVRVMVIDADMRKPRLHKIFKLDNTVGLSSYLSGIEELGDNLIKATDIPNLDIITSGPTPPNPAELLGSYRFLELLKGLYLYNFIVIDTPPVLGISDPLIISPHTDGVILVVKSGETPKEAAQEARRMLATVNAKILGVILNSIDQSAMRYSHYYNYYKYYYSDENR